MIFAAVYQFFDDKDAIVDVLAARYIREYSAEVDANVSRVAALPREERASAMIELYVEKYRTSRSFRAIWAGGHLSPDLRRADEENNEALVRAGIDLLRPPGMKLDLVAYEEALRVAVYAHEGLIRRAFRDDPEGDESILQEAKILVGDPIDTSHMTIQDRESLTLELHTRIAGMLGEPVVHKAAC